MCSRRAQAPGLDGAALRGTHCLTHAVVLLQKLCAAGIEGGKEALELWEAVVEIRDKHDGSGEVDFVPVSVKRKHAYHSTLTLSPSALALAMGQGNATQPLGTESQDLGLARSADGRRDEL